MVHIWIKKIKVVVFPSNLKSIKKTIAELYLEDFGCHGLKDISTPDFSTPSFKPGPFNPRLFNHELFNPGLFNHGVEMFMVEKFGLKYHLSIRLKDISTPAFSTPDFSTINFSTPWFKNSWLKSPGLKSSWLKSLGLKGSGLKLGVEKSGVEMSFNHLMEGSNNQLQTFLINIPTGKVFLFRFLAYDGHYTEGKEVQIAYRLFLCNSIRKYKEWNRSKYLHI